MHHRPPLHVLYIANTIYDLCQRYYRGDTFVTHNLDIPRHGASRSDRQAEEEAGAEAPIRGYTISDNRVGKEARGAVNACSL